MDRIIGKALDNPSEKEAISFIKVIYISSLLQLYITMNINMYRSLNERVSCLIT